MNTNDLPPMAQLAALIETGRAANPDLGHGREHMLYEGKACALGFAELAAGVPRDLVGKVDIPKVLPIKDSGTIWRVTSMNDRGASLEEICHSLREGALALCT